MRIPFFGKKPDPPRDTDLETRQMVEVMLNSFAGATYGVQDLVKQRGWMYGANRQIAGRASRTEAVLELVKKLPSGKVEAERLFVHPVLTLLDNPNADETGMGFRWRQVIQLQTLGASFVLVLPEAIVVEKGMSALTVVRVEELRLLDPMRVTPEQVGRRALGQFVYKTEDGQEVTYRAAPQGVHEIRQWKRDPYPFVYRSAIPDGSSYGASGPAMAGADAIEALGSLGKLHKNQLKNGTHSSLIFKMLTESDNPERFNQAVALLKAGISMAGEPIIIPKDRFEIEKNPATNSEMQYTDLSETSRQQLLAVLGGSDSLVGLVTGVNRANLWAQEWALAIGTVDPLNDLLADAFNAYVLPLFPGQSDSAKLRLSYETSAMRDEKDEADLQIALVSGKIKTQNEARETLGLPALEGGDSLGSTGGDGGGFPEALDGIGAETTDIAESEDERTSREMINQAMLELIQQAAWKAGDFNLQTEEGRAAKWRSLESDIQPFVDEFEDATREIFKRMESSILDKLAASYALPLADEYDRERGERIGLLAALYASEDWEKDFKEAYKRIAPRVVIASVIKTFGDLNIDKAFDVYDQRIQVFVEQQSFRFVKNIDETTRKQLAGMLEKALEDGLSVDAFRVQIEEKFAEYAGTRAQMMARTEMGAAENFGTQFAMEESRALGIKSKKMWLSARDGRVRDSHIAADGQTRKVEEFYSVGRCNMLYPQDGSRCNEPGEIIYCRCRSVAITL